MNAPVLSISDQRRILFLVLALRYALRQRLDFFHCLVIFDSLVRHEIGPVVLSGAILPAKRDRVLCCDMSTASELLEV